MAATLGLHWNKVWKIDFLQKKKKFSRSLLSGTKNKTSKKPVKLFYFLPIFMNFVFPHFSDFWGPLNLRGLLKKTQRLDALSGPLKTFLKYCPLSKGEHQDLAFLRYLYNFRAKKKYPHFILYFCYTTTQVLYKCNMLIICLTFCRSPVAASSWSTGWLDRESM